MQDSNQFHAVALDTYPPCVYMNDVSHSIVGLVHLINKLAGRTLVKLIAILKKCFFFFTNSVFD